MRGRRGQGSIAASPVLIGATTVLVALVAVFIAYNANSGLPFVPTYELNAELPSGGKLVKGNEVRVGGFRVGVVKELTPKVTIVNGERRSIAVARLSLDKKLEPLVARLGAPRAAALRARPEVHRAPAGHEQGHLPVGRHRPGEAGVRAARVRGPVLDLRPRHAPAHPARHGGLRQRVRRPRPVAQPLDRGAQPVLPGAHPGDDEPLGPAHRARPVLPPDRPRLGAGRPGGAHAGAPLHRHGRHVRGDLGRPARAPGHDREGRADDGRVDRLVPRTAAVPRGLHRPLGAAAPGRGRAAALAAGDQQRLRRGHAGAAADGGAEREPREGAARGGGPVREPEHAARAEGPDNRRDGVAARRSSTSRPTRRSATTSSTSSTRWARCSPWSRPARPAAGPC